MRTRVEKSRATRSPRIVSDALYQPDPTLLALGPCSFGIAVFDRKLRYRAVNSALAAFHGSTPREHLGRPLRSFLGSVGDRVAPLIERAFRTHRPVLGYELSGKFPKRQDITHWRADYVPILDAKGHVRHVCAVVVELTREKKLEEALEHCRGTLLRRLAYAAQWSEMALVQSSKAVAAELQRQAAIKRNMQTFRDLEKIYRDLLRRITIARRREGEPSEIRASASGWPQRQRTVMRLIIEGKSVKEIAALLDLSPRTVGSEQARIFKGLGFESLTDAVRYAIRTRMAAS